MRGEDTRPGGRRESRSRPADDDLKPQIRDLNSKQKRGQGDTLASRDYSILRAMNYCIARKNFIVPVGLTVAGLTVLTVVQTGVPLRLSVPTSVPWKVMMRSPLTALVKDSVGFGVATMLVPCGLTI